MSQQDSTKNPGVHSTAAPDPDPGRDQEPVLRLLNVSKVYEGTDTPAIDRINIDIQEGEFFSILGPSGSGKTTTLRVIAGFELPTSGSVYLGGEDVTYRPSNKRDVNTVFQNYALFPHMTVSENVAYPLKMRRIDKAEIHSRVSEILEKVEMGAYGHRKPNQLSGGQRQRVALARALVGHPRVLLLDEPLGALDLKLRETMLVVLRSLQREVGVTFVYITHDQGEALGMSDRIAVMNHKGIVEQIAPPDDLYRNPSSDFVARFIGKTNLIDCTREAGGYLTAGSLRIIKTDDEGTAQNALLSLRPEDIIVGPDAFKLANSFGATIEEILFLGHEKELVTRVGDQVLVVRVSGQQWANRGDQIQLGWPADGGVLVSQSADQSIGDS
jgi:ABC-type Fe3+/spermidine/putrescine transport system ATPase subunit